MSRKRKNMSEETNGAVATEEATPTTTTKPKRVESKADRFRRLATRRVNAALKIISRISTLSNRGSYEYSPEQAAKIVRVLQEAVAVVKVRLEGSNVKEDGFNL